MAQGQGGNQSRETVGSGNTTFMERWITLGRKLQKIPNIAVFLDEFEPALSATADGQGGELCIVPNVSSGQVTNLTLKTHALKT